MSTPEIEKKIEAEFEAWIATVKWEQSSFYGNEFSLLCFKAAALPLHKEVQELREALDKFTFMCLDTNFGFEHMDKAKEVRAKFKLGEVQP
jgi:hypothetical protein